MKTSKSILQECIIPRNGTKSSDEYVHVCVHQYGHEDESEKYRHGYENDRFS